MTNYLDSTLRQFQQDYEQVIGDVNHPDIPAILGDPDGNLFANTEETKVYVRGFGVDPDSFTTIPASGIPKSKLIPGQPVLIKLTRSGQYRFVALDAQADELFASSVSENPTQLPVYLNQIRYGTIHPTGNLSVLVVSAFYGSNYVGDLTTDLFNGTALDTSSNPISVPSTNNKQIAVLIQVDATNGVLEYKQSSEYSASISPTRAYANSLIPLPDSNRNRAGYVFLKAGMTAITYGDIWEAPELISNASTASVNLIASYENPLTVSATLAGGTETITRGTQTESPGVIRTTLGIWWDL